MRILTPKRSFLNMNKLPPEKRNLPSKKLQSPLYVFISFLIFFVIRLASLESYLPEDKQLTMKNEKYIIPILCWGPNNMIQGLRESLFIADTLGRKVIYQ